MKNIKQNCKLLLIILLTVVFMLVIVFIVGRSFGFFKYAKEGDKVNVVAIKGINVEIINPESAALSLENAYPVADSEGLTYTPFTFTMTNTSSRDLNYTLLVENDLEKQESCVLTDNTICPMLSTDYIRYSYLMDDGIYSEPETLGETGNVITNGIMKANETVTVSIILWVSSEAGNEIMNNYFYGKIIVKGYPVTQYTMTNLITNGSFEDGLNEWTNSNVEISTIDAYHGNNALRFNHNNGADFVAMTSQVLSITSPILNHKYYGSVMFKSSDAITYGDTRDARFEWFYTDLNEAKIVFANKTMSTSEWIMLSSISSITSSDYLDKVWKVRNFQRGASDYSYADSLILVDLTEIFGSGNEPDKEWCDDNIDYFEGTITVYK